MICTLATENGLNTKQNEFVTKTMNNQTYWKHDNIYLYSKYIHARMYNRHFPRLYEPIIPKIQI